MRTTATYPTGNSSHFPQIIHKSFVLKSIENWIDRQQPVWESNRLGISAVGIFIQSTVAAVMIALLGIAGAPALVFTTGIFFSFLANSLAFAQSPMKIVIGMFLVSMLVNASLTIYYVVQLLGN